MLKRISFFAVIVLFSVAVPVNAQDSTSLAGKYALQFQVSQNFTLSNFLGSVISGKYHFTDETAIRIGLGFSASMNNHTAGTQTNTASASRDTESNSQSFDVTVQYIITPVNTEKIRFYCGLGPKAGLNFSKNKRSSVSSISKQYSDKISDNGYSVGALCSVGVEWFMKTNLSLCAEYEVTYLYSYSKYSTYYPYNGSLELKTYSSKLSGDNVRLGLSIYF